MHGDNPERAFLPIPAVISDEAMQQSHVILLFTAVSKIFVNTDSTVIPREIIIKESRYYQYLQNFLKRP